MSDIIINVTPPIESLISIEITSLSEPLIDIQVLQNTANQIASPDSLIFNEVPTGVINGVNPIFFSAFNFQPETLQVFIGGLKLQVLVDYNTVNSNKIILYVSPIPEDVLTLNYIKL